MKNNLTKELPLIAIAVIPFLYLAYIWNSLPDSVPMHYDINGEIDRYGSKIELVLVALMLPILSYGIMQLAPLIDPKKQIEKMGNKYFSLKFTLVSFMSILATYILYTTKNPGSMSNNIVYVLIGGLFVILGNYMKTIKANYFVGIRTPWTLESPEVWRKTHNMAGYLWIAGGLVVIVGSLVLSAKPAFYLLMICTVLLTIVSIGYSFKAHKDLETN